MSRRWTHNRLLFTKLQLLKNLKKTLNNYPEELKSQPMAQAGGAKHSNYQIHTRGLLLEERLEPIIG